MSGFVGEGRHKLSCLFGVALQCGRGTAAGKQAPNPGRGLQLYVDPLGAILKKPTSELVRCVVALDEVPQLVVHDAATLGVRERPSGLGAIVAHVPVSPGIESQPTAACGHIGPFLQCGQDDGIHALARIFHHGRARVGCDAVRWQGETTLRARARKEEQRGKRAAARLNRVRSARYKLDLTLEAKKVRIHAVFLEARERPGEKSGLAVC